MTLKLGPYLCKGVINCGDLEDRALEDARAAMARSREETLRWLGLIKQAHADWLQGHRLSGRRLREAGTPFSAAYNELEDCLRDNPPPPKPPRPKTGVVYFIGLEGDNSAVKIGFASKLEDGVATLQTSSHHTFKVLGAIKGTVKVEKELHRKFAADRIRGEWFRRTEAIKAFIAASGSN